MNSRDVIISALQYQIHHDPGLNKVSMLTITVLGDHFVANNHFDLMTRSVKKSENAQFKVLLNFLEFQSIISYILSTDTYLVIIARDYTEEISIS